MAHIAVRSISTVGYIGATLLIAFVTILALVSLSDDGSGTEAVTTSTPTASPSGAGPASPFGSIAEGDEAAGPLRVVNVRARACDEIPGITEAVTIRSARDGDARTDCGCAGGPVACVNGGSAGD